MTETCSENFSADIEKAGAGTPILPKNADTDIGGLVFKSIDGNKAIQKILTEKEIYKQKIAKNLKVFFPNGEVIECRILFKDGGIFFGYFSDIEELSKIAVTYNQPEVLGIYVTLNPVKRNLLARCANRVKRSKNDHSTSDKDILCRKWLLIDMDSEREADISSTDQEHENAIKAVFKVKDYLTSLGWPEPVIGDSGNGAALLYSIDLPAKDNTVEEALKVLDRKFSDDKVGVDISVYNPARLRRLFGTMNRKGDNFVGVDGVEDRPWRETGLLSIPETILTVSKEQLEGLVNEESEPTVSEPERIVQVQDPTPEPKNLKKNSIIVERVLKSMNIENSRKDWKGGYSWDLKKCPMSTEHSDGAWITLLPNGAIDAGCQHESCKKDGWSWKELRAKYDPEGPKPQEEGKPKSKNPMNILINAIEKLLNDEKDARLIFDSLGKPYLWVKVGDHFEMIESNHNSKAFNKFCFKLVQDKHGITLRDDETFKKALLAIEVKAEEITVKKELDLNSPVGYRRTWHNNAAWYDLCNKDWTGIQIDENGYRKVALPPIFLRRGTESPQVEPVYDAKPEEVDRIFKYINIIDEDKRLLLKAWICASIAPNFKGVSLPQPILSFGGVTGSGKTVASKFLKCIIDPSEVEVRRLPEDVDDLGVMLNRNGMVIFDNIGTKISQDISDALCIAATKGYITKRKLYTDDEEAILG